MSAWGTNQQNAVQTNAPKVTYGEEYFRDRFKNNLAQAVDIRMALVAREDYGKTGLALSMLDEEIKAGQKVAVFDVDNSAKSTVDYIYPNAENIMVIPLHDETDDSIFNEDNSVNHKSLLDKTSWCVNILADEIAAAPDAWG